MRKARKTKGKASASDPQAAADYQSLLSDTDRQLDALVYELETQTTKSTQGQNIPMEISFDCVPVIRKLKEAQKLLRQSPYFH